jgi:hypothetical protein
MKGIDMKEYIIWGVPKGEEHSIPLHTLAKSSDEAKKIQETLEQKYGCIDTSIQVIDFDKDISAMWKSRKLLNI